MEKLFKKNIWGERKDTLMRKCLKEKVLRKIEKKIEEFFFIQNKNFEKNCNRK